MADPDTSIYPKAPSGGIGSMSLMDLINAANSATQLGTDLAVGRETKRAADPSQIGGVNQQKLQEGLVRNPAVQRQLPTLMRQTAEGQKQQSDIGSAWDAGINEFIGSNVDNVRSRADLEKYLLAHAANTNIPWKHYQNIIDTAPKSPAAFRKFMTDRLNIAQGSAGAAGGQEVVRPSGAKEMIPGAEAQHLRRGGPVQPRVGAVPAAGPSGALTAGQVTALPTGTATEQEASAKTSIGLREAADTSPQRKAMLGNLEEYLNNFTAGPKADWSRVGKAFINRNIPLPKGWQFDPKSIADQEKFVKESEMLAQQQFAAIGGTGTDAKFSSAFRSNPNEELSQMGNQAIIRMLKGNEDAIQAKNKAWLAWKRRYGPGSYDEFSADFNELFDPRTFQFRYMTPKERQTYIDQMDPNDRAQFLSNLAAAARRGWVTAGERKDK